MTVVLKRDRTEYMRNYHAARGAKAAPAHPPRKERSYTYHSAADWERRNAHIYLDKSGQHPNLYPDLLRDLSDDDMVAMMRSRVACALRDVVEQEDIEP